MLHHFNWKYTNENKGNHLVFLGFGYISDQIPIMHRFLKKWYQMYGQQNPSNQRNIFFIETCSIDSIHLQNDTVFAFLISQKPIKS